MNLDKVYNTDKEAAENGKWMVTQSGFDVKVAKLGNPAFNAEVTRLQKPHLAVLRSGADCSEIIDRITIAAMAKTVLMDWKAEDDAGNDVPYTPELGEQFMAKYPEFKQDVSELSATRSNFKPEELAEK